MLKLKNFALPIFAMVAAVSLGGAQAALADHDHWRNDRYYHSRHSNQVVYRAHHNSSNYNKRYYNRHNNRPRSVSREVRHVLRHI